MEHASMGMKIAGLSKDEKESNTNKLNENHDIIQGIIKMMDKITERIFPI